MISGTREAGIDTSCDSGTSMLETYYSNFIARQLYAQKVPEVQEESIFERVKYRRLLIKTTSVAKLFKISVYSMFCSITTGGITTFCTFLQI